MSLGVFLAVLAAALLHAGWNALIKVGLDRFSSVLLLGLVQAMIAALLLPVFGLPPAAAWPWVIGSAALHSAYKIFLIRAYSHGDLSQVYPLARGTAPMIVAIVGALFLGEGMDLLRIAAILAIAGGIVLMAGGGSSRLSRQALLYALATAVSTASYTLADGVGARIAGAASAFTLAMFVFDGLFMLGFGLFARGPSAIAALLPAWRSGLAAGAMSLGSYWIAIWAFTQAPLAMVAALRECSVLFAMLIAFFLLHEPISRRRATAAALILAGILLMRV